MRIWDGTALSDDDIERLYYERGEITTEKTGGIVGPLTEGRLIIENCHVNGDIYESGGGIMGGYNYGTIDIKNSSFTGGAEGNNWGGMSGIYSGYSKYNTENDVYETVDTPSYAWDFRNATGSNTVYDLSLIHI